MLDKNLNNNLYQNYLATRYLVAREEAKNKKENKKENIKIIAMFAAVAVLLLLF